MTIIAELLNFNWLTKHTYLTYDNDIDALLVTIKIFQMINAREGKSFGKLMQKKHLSFPLCNNAIHKGVCCDDCILYRHTDENCDKYIKLLLGKEPITGVELFLEILRWIETMANQ